VTLFVNVVPSSDDVIARIMKAGLLYWLGLAVFSLAFGIGIFIIQRALREWREVVRLEARLEEVHGLLRANGPATGVRAQSRPDTELLQEAAEELAAMQQKVRALGDVATAIKDAMDKPAGMARAADACGMKWPANVFPLPIVTSGLAKSSASESGACSAGER
jgi:hypothetical protein